MINFVAENTEILQGGLPLHGEVDLQIIESFFIYEDQPVFDVSSSVFSLSCCHY